MVYICCELQAVCLIRVQTPLPAPLVYISVRRRQFVIGVRNPSEQDEHVLSKRWKDGLFVKLASFFREGNELIINRQLNQPLSGRPVPLNDMNSIVPFSCLKLPLVFSVLKLGDL